MLKCHGELVEPCVKATDEGPFDKLRVTRTVVYKQTLNKKVL